ncbi:MAG: FHA domain-containing protein [Planctomycetes bacterium]|nr:FHA domain-containing protein [Planctomycetota bacterium]
MARLTISGPDGARDVVLGDKLVIGRVEGADLVLDDKGISRRHCEFERRGDGYVVRDLGSSNGTLVNGDKITERPLVAGDRVRVGGVTLTYATADADALLRFVAGEHAGRDVPLSGARTTLGRRPENAVAFVDVKVSGVHLEIVREDDGYVLRDLGSTNGTLLDGKRVTTEVALSHGDRVQIGASEFRFVDSRRGELAAGGVSRNEVSAAGGGAAHAATLPPQKSKVGAILSLAGVALAVGGAGAWYFMQGQEAPPASGRQAPAAPSGTLLVEDWSFELPGEVDSLWGAELGAGFSARRGRAASGSYALVASVADGQATASRRQRVALASSRPLHASGQLSADDGALGSVALRFLGDDADGATPRQWSVVLATSNAAGFASFECDVDVPAWATGVEVVVVARGTGEVALDDLALTPGSAPTGRAAFGDLALAPRGPASWFVDYHAPLLELFEPTGEGAIAAAELSAEEDGARRSGSVAKGALPPGAFLAPAKQDGAAFALDPGRAPFAASGFAFELAPELAARGVTLLGELPTDRRFGPFVAEGVKQLLLGAAAERFEIALSAATKVTATQRGDVLRIELALSAPLRVTLRSDFTAERAEASVLVAKAQEEWRAGKAGTALGRLREIRERLPHDDKAVDTARKLESEIVPKLEAELAVIDAEATGAEFLGSLDHYRSTLARARAVLPQAEGIDSARALAARVERMQAQAAVMERERREEEAARLFRLARAYQAQLEPAPLRPATAAELLAELQRSYGDTTAAREARGETAPEPVNVERGSIEGGN